MPQQLSDITQTDTKQYYGAQEAIPLLVIDNKQCYAVISLVGGQILAYKQRDKAPLLWLSPKVVFKKGTAIRGGIPLCAPWFGKHPKTNSPNHGFARTSLWHHSASHLTTQGKISITLELSNNEHSKTYYDHDFTMGL
ncbi:MAG: D-hexose-6-phosphate mutarotase, partial [Psychrobium sp.]|nr:D-hexose-6-phosphate mutarotase [Psychrobium sp.]